MLSFSFPQVKWVKTIYHELHETWTRPNTTQHDGTKGSKSLPLPKKSRFKIYFVAARQWFPTLPVNVFFGHFFSFFMNSFMNEWLNEWNALFCCSQSVRSFLVYYISHTSLLYKSLNILFQYMFRFFSILRCLHWGEPLFLKKCLVTPEYQPHTRPTSQPVRFAKTCHDSLIISSYKMPPLFS